MKKSLMLLSTFLVVCTAAICGDFAFVFKGIETNPEFLYDFFPTYYKLGVSYTGFEIIDGIVTEVTFIGRGGYGHTKLWTDASGFPVDPGSIDIDTGIFRDLQSYNNVLLGADLRLQQFLNPTVRIPRGDLAVYAEYGISWMHPLENEAESYGLDGTEAAYPDRNGAVWNSFSVGGFLDAVYKGVAPGGYRGEVTVELAPAFLANSVVGRTDYSLVGASFIYYLPFFSFKQANGLNLVALYLADRVAANILLGDAVPQREQKPVALGTMIRGFEKNSLGTRFTAVNNLELRLAGPEIFIENLYPRLHIFLDLGTYAGEYLNTTYTESGFLASTGFEISLTVFNLFSFGYRGAFALLGTNIAESVFTGGIMVNLQF